LQNVDVANAVDAARQANYDAGATSAFSISGLSTFSRLTGSIGPISL
jgi:hypothetical protein